MKPNTRGKRAYARGYQDGGKTDADNPYQYIGRSHGSIALSSWWAAGRTIVVQAVASGGGMNGPNGRESSRVGGVAERGLAFAYREVTHDSQ